MEWLFKNNKFMWLKMLNNTEERFWCVTGVKTTTQYSTSKANVKNKEKKKKEQPASEAASVTGFQSCGPGLSRAHGNFRKWGQSVLSPPKALPSQGTSR